MITKKFVTSTITATRIVKTETGYTEEAVQIQIEGNVKNENSAFKQLCSALGMNAYTNIHIDKAEKVYAISEEDFFNHAHLITEGSDN